MTLISSPSSCLSCYLFSNLSKTDDPECLLLHRSLSVKISSENLLILQGKVSLDQISIPESDTAFLLHHLFLQDSYQGTADVLSSPAQDPLQYQVWFLWNFYTSVYDLKWLFCQSLKTFLPDPVCVQCIVLSGTSLLQPV